jgi:hypothetical protein
VIDQRDAIFGPQAFQFRREFRFQTFGLVALLGKVPVLLIACQGVGDRAFTRAFVRVERFAGFGLRVDDLKLDL